MRGEPVDVTMGHVNVIWQGDANAQVLRCLAHCTTPTTPINVTGPETISIRWLAHAARRAPRHGGEDRRPGGGDGAALRHDARRRRCSALRSVPLGRMLDWVADWVEARRHELRQADQVRGSRWRVLTCSRSSGSALDDVAGGLALSDAAGWNQTADDWSLFIAAGAAFGVRDEAGALIATAAALPYDAATGWISMVLVDAAHRHRGIASQLVDACVASLRDAGRIAGARRDAGRRRGLREDRLRRRVRVRALGGRRRGDDRGDRSRRSGRRRRPVADRDADRPRPRRRRRRSRAAAAIVPGAARDARLARSARRRLRARAAPAAARADRSDRRRRRRGRARAARGSRSTASPAASSSTSRCIARRSPTR